MSKTEALEKRMIARGMQEDDFAEFQQLIRRVPGNFLKMQHCYTTAIQFPAENNAQAIRLIQYGLDHFPDSWSSSYMAYLAMGHIWTGAEAYQHAHRAYTMALQAVPAEQQTHQAEAAIHRLWARLHMDGFAYSRELEDDYRTGCGGDGFFKAFVHVDFKLTIAALVIARHYHQQEDAWKAYGHAMEMCAPDYRGDAYDTLKRHRYEEELKATPQALQYLRDMQTEIMTPTL